jgi:hypothetical protein
VGRNGRANFIQKIRIKSGIIFGKEIHDGRKESANGNGIKSAGKLGKAIGIENGN